MNYQEIIVTMAPPLRVYLSIDGVRTFLGQLTFQQVVVGRESPDGFIIKSPAVSREHGIFISVGRNWFFKDLGSTNGTWLNDVQILPGSLCLLKIGDALQLGDSLLELLAAEVGEEVESRTSAIVFLRGNHVDEFFLPPSGPLLVVGGPKSHLKKDIPELDLPSLVIERRGNDVTAVTVDPKAEVYLQEQLITFATKLKDRDVLKIQSYTIHISLGTDLQNFSTTTVSIQNDSAQISSQGVALKDWDDDLPKRAPNRTNFGKLNEKNIANEAATTTSSKIFSTKGLSSEDKQERLETVELSFVFIVGGILIILLLCLAVYFFLL